MTQICRKQCHNIISNVFTLLLIENITFLFLIIIISFVVKKSDTVVWRGNNNYVFMNFAKLTFNSLRITSKGHIYIYIYKTEKNYMRMFLVPLRRTFGNYFIFYHFSFPNVLQEPFMKYSHVIRFNFVSSKTNWQGIRIWYICYIIFPSCTIQWLKFIILFYIFYIFANAS